jgi:cell wall-associated NlpC family hydrolase
MGDDVKTLRLAGPPYQHGAKALQQALIERGLLPAGAADDQYGPSTARAVEKAKWMLGYPASAIHHGHEYAGDAVLAYLTGRQHPPLAYAERARARAAHLPPVDHDAQARARVVACYRELIANAALIDYAEVRPIPTYLGAIRPRTQTDCSGSITWACTRAHVPDPNGLNNGQGYTGTMLDHLAHIPRSEVKAGDLVVWTPPATGQHVCIFIDPATGLLGSFGSDPGPRTISYQDENAYQSSHGHATSVYLRLRTS